MILKEKIVDKEKRIRELLEKLRGNLNEKSLSFNNNPNDWSYITSLTYTESKLKEIIDYFETLPI